MLTERSIPPTVRRTGWLWPLVAVFACVAAVAAAWVNFRSPPPFRIAGPSMAEAFCGRHGKLTCERCRFVYRFDLEGVAAPDRLICPNCGRLQRDGLDIQVAPGDRVQIHAADAPQKLQRFDVVAFEVPGEAGTLAVKRIVGLPGEQVAIRGGDIYIDGQLLAKDDAAQRQTRVLVHVNSPGQARWQPSASANDWRIVDEGGESQFHFHSPSASAGRDVQWVEYHHQRVHDSPGAARGGILDNDPYNPALSRQLNDVYDIGLELHGTLNGSFAVRAHDGWRDWIVYLDPEIQLASIRCGDRDLVSVIWHAPRFHDPDHHFDVQLRVCDGRVSLWLDRKLIVQEAIMPGDGPRSASATPLAFGASEGEMRISTSLRVYRDLYYIDPVGLPRPWAREKRLGEEEYFLLGDNVPVSTDSRHFGPVERSQIRGRVSHWPGDR